MREIKFRAWEPETEMGKPGNMSYDQDFCLSQIRHPDGIFIMQFTGLHDKNGKEIWEGDILYQEILSPDDPALAGRYGNDSPVEFFRGVYRVCFNEKWYILSADVAAGTLEVIGNIYENSELVSGGTNGD